MFKNQMQGSRLVLRGISTSITAVPRTGKSKVTINQIDSDLYSVKDYLPDKILHIHFGLYVALNLTTTDN